MKLPGLQKTKNKVKWLKIVFQIKINSNNL